MEEPNVPNPDIRELPEFGLNRSLLTFNGEAALTHLHVRRSRTAPARLKVGLFAMPPGTDMHIQLAEFRLELS